MSKKSREEEALKALEKLGKNPKAWLTEDGRTILISNEEYLKRMGNIFTSSGKSEEE